MDQETNVICRRLFDVSLDHLVNFVIQQLAARAVEVGQESDTDLRGVRTIIQWLQIDLFAFQSQKHLLHRQFPNLVESDGPLEQVDDILGVLLRECRAILIDGNDSSPNETARKQFNGEHHQKMSILADYFSNEVSSGEFKNRFCSVGDRIRMALSTIRQLRVHEARDGKHT